MIVNNKLEEHILIPAIDYWNFDKFMDFSIFIKDKKSKNPITLLSVVPNDEEAEHNMIKAKKRLESLASLGTAAEANIDIIATIDHNVASGIARTSKEIQADPIVIGWPAKGDLFDKIFGEKIESLINATDKNIFMAMFTKPLLANKRILVFVPPLAEYEIGFTTWFDKVKKLSSELSLPIIFYSNNRSADYIKKLNGNLKQTFKNFDFWQDFTAIEKEVLTDDLLILISARKGSVSYFSPLDALPAKIEKHFEINTRIVVYPRLYAKERFQDNFEGTSYEPLTRSLDTNFQNLKRWINSTFRRK